MTTQALLSGVQAGRNGKGSIFVFASGNGGALKDNCNCDGYVNSIYTLSVAGATEEGDSISFSEPCSAILTTAFSGYEDYENKITTTDTSDSQCTGSFGGTSAATSMVSAIVALALQVGSNLTWRDVQHIGELVILHSHSPLN